MGQVCKIMRNALKIWMRMLLAVILALALAPPASARKGKHHADLTVNECLPR